MAFVATLFVCVIVSGVWKLNSMDSKIEEKANDGDNYVTEQTAEPESTYYVWDGKKKKHPKKKKTGKHKKTVKKGNRKNITTNKKHPGKKDVVPDQDEEPAKVTVKIMTQIEKEWVMVQMIMPSLTMSKTVLHRNRHNSRTQRVTSLIKQIQLSL